MDLIKGNSKIWPFHILLKASVIVINMMVKLDKHRLIKQ